MIINVYTKNRNQSKMSKDLQFIQIGNYLHKRDSLQHITEMINVKLVADDTYRDLFNKLELLFPQDGEDRTAIKNWIQLNIDGQDDPSILDTTAMVVSGEAYASFNLYNI